MLKKPQTRKIEMKILQDLRTECIEGTETLKRTQAEMKMKLRNPLTQLENSKGSSISRRKVENLNKIKIKTQEKGIQEIWGIMYKPNLQIIEYVSSLNKGNIYSYRCKTPNRQDQKENIHGLSIENKKVYGKRRETQVAYNGKFIRIIASFSVDTLRGRQAQRSASQVLKDYYSQPRLTHPESHHQS